MTAPDRHWFYIEQVMTEVRALCVDARARELRDGRPRSEDLIARELAISPEGEAVTEVGSVRPFVAVGDLSFGQPLDQPLATVSFDQPLDLQGRAQSAAGSMGSDVVALRKRIRERLLWLQARLKEGLTAREAYHVLFPLVIHVDEMVLSATRGRAAGWKPLQLSFFEIDDGGERFYSVLDVLFGKEDTLPLVFEAFYFCLKDGFVGLHAGNPGKLDEYMSTLASRIPQSTVELGELKRDAESQVRLVEFPRRYYLTAAAVVLGVFLLLHVASYFDVGRG